MALRSPPASAGGGPSRPARLFHNLGSRSKAPWAAGESLRCEKTRAWAWLRPEGLGLYGQATKGMRWMPRRQEAMKDVAACDKPRGAGKQALIRGSPNGATRPASAGHPHLNP